MINLWLKSVLQESLQQYVRQGKDCSNKSPFHSMIYPESLKSDFIILALKLLGFFRTIEDYAESLVSLLVTCLGYNLRPLSGGPDPPHAKLASDVMSCIFLVSHLTT